MAKDVMARWQEFTRDELNLFRDLLEMEVDLSDDCQDEKRWEFADDLLDDVTDELLRRDLFDKIKEKADG